MVKAKLTRIKGRVQQADHGFWAGVFFFLLVLAGISYLANQMYGHLMSTRQMPLSSLTLSGERQYSRDQEVQQVLATLSNQESFFSLNVDQVKTLVEQIPWIAKASVRRQWPNGLHIHVVDQVPVAYWNDRSLLNIKGEIFNADQARLKLKLPRFYGSDEEAATVLAGYRALYPLLSSEGISLRTITLSPRQSWQVTINNDLNLVLGRVNTVIRNVRVERFLKVYKHMINKKRLINYVDLRYDTGFAVNWKVVPGEKANNEQG